MNEQKTKQREKENIIDFIKKSRFSIIIIIIVALFAFGQRIISQGFSIDTELYINDIGVVSRWDWWIALNRWGLVLLNKIFLMDSLPIFACNFLTVTLMIVYSILFNYLFYTYIKDNYKETFLKYQFIFPILFITNPIFAEQYNFILQNVGVAFTIALIPLILLLIDKASIINTWWQKIIFYTLPICMLILLFGVYQSVILLYIATVVVCYLLKVLKEKDNSWKYLGKQIGIFLLAAIIYLTIGKILTMNNSNSGSSYLQSAWLKDTPSQCIMNIKSAIIPVLKCEGIFYNFGYILSIIASLVFVFYLSIKKKLKIGVIIGMIGLLAAPFYIMIITGVDQLKRTQFNYSFVIGIVMMFAIVVLSKINKLKWLRNIGIAIILILTYIQCYTTSNLFNTVDVTYKNDEAFAHNVIQKIEEKDWYDNNKDYTLIFIGEHVSDLKNLYIKSEIIGRSFFEFDYQYIYGVSSRAVAFLNILGSDFNMPTKEEFENAKQYVEEKKMPIYPKEEAIQLIDNNKIIVRLSEEY